MAHITWIDDGERLGACTHPFRLNLVGASVIVEVILKWLMLPAIPGAMLMFLGMVLSWMFGNIEAPLLGAWPLLLGWAIGLGAALSFCTSNYYDREAQQFVDEVRVFGRRVRRFAWPRALFTEISYGRNGISSIAGWATVVRLHTTLDGFHVDSFFPVEDMERARLIAQMLEHALRKRVPVEHAFAIAVLQLPNEADGATRQLNELVEHLVMTALGHSRHVLHHERSRL